MIDVLLENIKNGIDTRQSLSQLRKELKEESGRDRISYLLQKVYDKAEVLELLAQNLQAEDAKTRKNAALLLGDIADAAGNVYQNAVPDILSVLYRAYEAEDTLFVKSAYLQAMENYDCGEYAGRFHRRLDELTGLVPTDENRKHITEEMRELTSLLIAIEGIQKHSFTGNVGSSEIMLLTNRKHIDITREELLENTSVPQDKMRNMAAGILLKTKSLDELFQVRTWQDMLFLVRGMKSCEADPRAAAKKVAESKLLDFLTESHSGTFPFYFRVELKSKLPLDKKSAFCKAFVAELERLTDRKLINSTSDYEVEIRLIENKEQSLNAMLKLYTISDDRFAYRTESMPTSIKPVNAALLTAIAKPYMIQDAQVLDPFCGVGTMLIERQKQMPANTSYGIDMQADAIVKAKINTENAGQIIHYINRDYFTFTHEYLFDEIFTNMPFAIGRVTQEEIDYLYEDFFKKSRDVLRKGGRIIMYTHDRRLAEEMAAENGYRILQQWQVNVKEATDLMVLKCL